MTTWILFTVLHTVSIGFALLTLWRLYRYIRRYRFDESKYTLLFGFVHLKWIALSYFALTGFWVLVSFLVLTVQ
ncbi:hypothetical protein HZA42_05055 [Candidatus Peregrinibacteria bacterium]|nr:hypothetical protein [Candidatus Peregrinibacteria bacterium]